MHVELIARGSIRASATRDDRPKLRGEIHRWAIPPALVGFAVLAMRGPDVIARVATSIHGITVITMIAVSASYHRSSAASRLHKPLDHATILLAIAGTNTAITALALSGREQATILALVWSAAAVGGAVRLTWLDAPYPITAAVYVIVGWLAVVRLSSYLSELSDSGGALILLGGVLYTVGAVVYALHRPNPWPQVFGYHEVFHTLVIGEATAHYLAVWLLVNRR